MRSTFPAYYRTNDGGKYWSIQQLLFPTQSEPGTNFSTESPIIFDEKNGIMFMLKSDAQTEKMDTGYYATTDGGTTWELKSIITAPGEPYVLKYDFISTNHGWVSIDSTNLLQESPEGTAKTTDGGITWEAMNPVVGE